MDYKNERKWKTLYRNFFVHIDEGFKRYEIVLIQSGKFRHHLTDEFLWTIPGGKIEQSDQGVTLEDRIISCAKRETMEELGVVVDSVQYYKEFDSTRTGTEIGYQDPATQFFFYECVAKAPTKDLQPGSDVCKAKWFSLEEVQELRSTIAEDIYQLLIEILTHTEKYILKWEFKRVHV